MKAAVKSRVTGVNRAAASPTWRFTESPQEIFEADDRGEVIYVETPEELCAELEILHPAPIGFTHVHHNTGYSYGGNRNGNGQISVTEKLIAKSFETALAVLGPEQGEILIDHKLIPEDVGVRYSSYFGEYNGTVINDCILVYQNGGQFYLSKLVYDADQIKELRAQNKKQERKRETNQKRKVRECRLLSGDLRLLHRGMVSASINQSVNCNLPRYTKKDDVIKRLNALRVLCKKLKRDYRSIKISSDYTGRSATVLSLLQSFYSFTAGLLKHKNEDYVNFGKWLRYEKKKDRKLEKLALAEKEKSTVVTVAKGAEETIPDGLSNPQDIPMPF